MIGSSAMFDRSQLTICRQPAAVALCKAESQSHSLVHAVALIESLDEAAIRVPGFVIRHS